jgi:hypothetical protein
MEVTRARSAAVMAETNRRCASARMTKNNPMRSEVTREKVRRTLIEI